MILRIERNYILMQNKQPDFEVETNTFLCDVGTELLNIMQINFRVQSVSSLFAST